MVLYGFRIVSLLLWLALLSPCFQFAKGDALYNESHIAHVTSHDHVFLLVLIPTDSAEKRAAIRRTWLNFSSLSLPRGLVDFKFLSDTIGDVDRQDTILTQAQDFVMLKNSNGKFHPVLQKMRAGARYSTIRKFFYCLWVEDDAIINVIDVITIAAEYHNRTSHLISRGLYMGTVISNSVDNPAWNPDYAKLTSLHNYPYYMHGSAMVFGSGLLPALASMDHHVGLVPFGAGDTTFGIWFMGMRLDLQKFPRVVQIDSFPKELDRHPELFCTQALYYHMLKQVEHIWKYGEWMQHCHEEMMRNESVQIELHSLAKRGMHLHPSS